MIQHGELHFIHFWYKHRRNSFHDLILKLTHFALIGFGSLLVHPCFQLLSITVLIGKLHIACTADTFGDFVYSVTWSMRTHTIDYAMLIARQCFPSKILQTSPFEKIPISYSDDSLCKKTVRGPGNDKSLLATAIIEFTAHMIGNRTLLGGLLS